MGINIITNIRHNSDVKTIRDLERLATSLAGPYLLADMLLGARYAFKSAVTLDAGRLGDKLEEVDNST